MYTEHKSDSTDWLAADGSSLKGRVSCIGKNGWAAVGPDKAHDYHSRLPKVRRRLGADPDGLNQSTVRCFVGRAGASFPSGSRKGLGYCGV